MISPLNILSDSHVFVRVTTCTVNGLRTRFVATPSRLVIWTPFSTKNSSKSIFWFILIIEGSWLFLLLGITVRYWRRSGSRGRKWPSPLFWFDFLDSQYFLPWAAQFSPVGRMGHVSDLNGAALYLASSASAFTTGSDLLVDGQVVHIKLPRSDPYHCCWL